MKPPSGLTVPPAPNINPNTSNALTPTTSMPAMSGNVLASQGASAMQAPGMAPSPQGQAPQPAPDNAETIALQRHLGAIEHELENLMANPALGRSDCKSAIIDGMTRLVSDRIMPASQAVAELTTLPPEPVQQRRWLMEHYAKTRIALVSLLEHHRAAHFGVGDMPMGDPNDHTAITRGAMARHYSPGSGLRG